MKDFWTLEYDSYTEKFRNEAISPILNKVGQFVTSPTIRNIINHPTNSVDLEEMMNQGKIIILNLAQGKIGEDNAALLGAMVISQLQIAAMNRVNIAKEERRDFFLYVDEFQNFATTSFVKILSEARKFRLNLILTNQYTAQLPEEIQKAIFGNAGTIISFVVGADDATRLIAETGATYTQDDLVSLVRYQIILKLAIDETISHPFAAYTLPLPFSKNQNKAKVLRASYERYYRKRAPEDITPASYAPPLPEEKSLPTPRSTAVRAPASPESHSGQVASPATPPRKRTEPLLMPPLEDLDRTRTSGFRPEVVGCFINDKKILFVYQKSHELWMLPQGGVENQEDLLAAGNREMGEELGKDFMHQVDVNFSYIEQDKVEFPKDKQDKAIKTDTGQSVSMKGKKYYFLATTSTSPELKINKTEYNDFCWLTYDEAIKLVKENNTGGRLRITNKALNTLKVEGLID